MLNSDWERMPNIKYACAQVLAGSILVNEKAGHAVLVNTLEAYCRLRSVDIHRELSNQHGSIPPPTSYYENVWPCVLTTSDGEKLTIGTQTMNALITSTIPPRYQGRTKSWTNHMHSRFPIQNNPNLH